tara:strand:+ start:275 stop:673 length:399 start_codon:yes stop_codon:yes gene_type:complete
MSKQEKSPSTPEEASNKKSESILDAQSVFDLADNLFEEWQPALYGKSATYLGKRLAVVSAQLAHAVKALQLQDQAIGNLDKRVLFLQKGYQDQCRLNDKWQSNFLEVSVKQKKFVEEVRAKLKEIEEQYGTS